MSNYSRGARVERLLARAMEARGYLVIRSAGSRGPIDLCVLNLDDVRLIQVKATQPDSQTLEALRKLQERLPAYSVELWQYLGRRRWRIWHSGEAALETWL